VSLAEPHMQLAKRAAPEMDFGDLQQRGLLRPQPAVIQRPKQGVVARGWSVFAGGRDPGLHEFEELSHPFWRWRWRQRRRIVADVTGGV
jgi:hypothetical protein